MRSVPARCLGHPQECRRDPRAEPAGSGARMSIDNRVRIVDGVSGSLPAGAPMALAASSRMNSCQRVLFLCTGNSCRSQMAEGIMNKRYGHRFAAFSAGTNPAGYVHRNAVAAMEEIGIDLADHRSKDIAEFLPPHGTPPDLIIGVCSSATENCPTFPAAVEHWHWPFDDPAHATGTDTEVMAEFVRVRDEICEKLDTVFGSTAPME